MKRYDERVLNRLLDKYEGSLLYTGKNQVNIKIMVPVTKSLVPEYFDESSTLYESIHEQLEVLEERELIRLVWKNGKQRHILEKCELIVEHADAAYAYLRRKPRNTKEQEIRSICNISKGRSDVLDRFLDWVCTRLDAGESIQKFVDIENPDEFRKICELVWKISENKADCFLRQFSVQHFHDSKLAEKEIEKAVSILSQFSGDGVLDCLTVTEVLEEYNIYRNPSWIMIKGSGYFRIGTSEINLDTVLGGFGISNQDLDKICWNQDTAPEKILTIENLTSFHQWNPSKEQSVLAIYLGGYHNQAKRTFLQNMYQAYPNAEYFHFGDIDCGGFRIWKDLCVKTGIPFKVLWMDSDIYVKYLDFGRELTLQDQKTLKMMMEDVFFEKQKELFALMLQKGKKLEQECVLERSGQCPEPCDD